MITANQLVAHLVGDYLLQSDWMAQNKGRGTWVALTHAMFYGLPFLLLTQSPLAIFAVVSTHAVIDHYRLARYVVFAKNFIAPRSEWPKWNECKETGYHQDRPAWLNVWLLIIADNTMHILINGAAITYL